MSDSISSPIETDKVLIPRLDWTVATKEGNRLCTTISKMIKQELELDTFKTEYITMMNEYLKTIFDIINNKVPTLEEFLEIRNMETLQTPDWRKAFLETNELRKVFYTIQ